MDISRGPTTTRLAICLIVPAPAALKRDARQPATSRPYHAESAGLPSLAELTPVGHEVTLISDDGTPLDWARLCRRYDVIALTGTLRQRPRLLDLLGGRRSGAATICVAGPIVTDDEPSLELLCNVRFVGPLEETWPRFIDDLAAGRRPLRRYRRPDVSWMRLSRFATHWTWPLRPPLVVAR